MYYMDECMYHFSMYKTAGKVDLEELISAFMDLGIEVDMEEARHLLSRFAICSLFYYNGFRNIFASSQNGSRW